jgi:hypothetical protein
MGLKPSGNIASFGVPILLWKFGGDTSGAGRGAGSGDKEATARAESFEYLKVV